ncbi:MAG: PilC/PilY family type IV pilus protein [Desulfobacterales bacterium]|jgi:type IV pilus assembly protein PilY1
MRKINYYLTATILLLCCLVLKSPTAIADDTCVFMVTADNVEPNIVVLLDNGAEMQHAVWHPDYDDSVDYTPSVASQVDVVPDGASGNGFFNEYGYGIYITGGKFYMTPVGADLKLITDVRLEGLESADKKSSTWTINGNTVTLPAIASTSVDGAGIIDNAGTLRYSKNYLNWIFFSGNYNGDGSDLPDKSRFYYAKKAIMTVAKLAANKANFSIYNFTDNADGASNVQPLGMVVNTPLAPVPEDNTLESNFVNNINNMGTVTYSPLAEGLARVGGYYGSPSSGVVGYYCQNNFVIVVSPGKSSEDQAAASQSSPASLSDYDGDGGATGANEGKINVDATTYSIPVNQNGTTYLDDVAYYLYANDIVDYHDGFQNIMTYTIGFMGDQLGNLFLINTSNNGNGNVNLYDTSDEEYGKYHYEAEDPDALAPALLAAVNDILAATSSFTAPVVPVTRTTSGNRIYMAFFKPEEDNFWEGNVTKFAISNNNEIVDANGNSATWPNGAIREDAVPYWQTKDWADPEKTTYVHNAGRNIYTYVGYTENLAHASNAFTADNPMLTAAVLGNPTHTPAEVINFVRGADVIDEDEDGDSAENRSIITGDVLHSEPLVFQYIFPDSSSKTMVYFGANDGMLHAVLDVTDPNVDVDNDETSHGIEAWGFIPPDQLHRLKDMLEGSTHSYYVDSSPKAYFHDVDADGRIDPGHGDRVILVCGARKGGTGYFALDVTYPLAPQFLWRIDRSNTTTGILELYNDTSMYSNNGGSFQDGDPLRIWDFAGGWGPDIAARVEGTMTGYFLRYDNGTIPFSVNQWVGNLTTAVYGDYMDGGTATPFIWARIKSITTADPDVIIPELGESWSEPQFGCVKTDAADVTGTPVFFIGGGYSSDHSFGKAVIAIDVMTGGVVKLFKNDFSITGMDYSIASTVAVIDADGNGFVDKLYVGDLGGQMWRLGNFTDPSGSPLNFPESDENIMNWTPQLLFVSDPAHGRKFYYPPGVTLENGYDLVFAGTGDREDPCNPASADRIYSIKDSHEAITINESDLVDVTNPAAVLPDLDNETADVDLDGSIDQGWYIQLAAGEKVLAENTIFYKTLYITTFTPNDDVCMPGGVGKLYGVEYKTGGAVLDFNADGSTERSTSIGGGIPSKVVTVITDLGNTKLFISVGSTNPDQNSESFAAGVVDIDPLTPKKNFFYLWWRELLNI